MTVMNRLVVSASLALVTLTGAAAARAEDVVVAGETRSVLRTPAEHPHWEIEVHGVIPYYRGLGFGGGARLGIPIIPGGFGSSLNNHLAITVGADLYYGLGYGFGGFIGIQTHVAAQWNVYFTEKLSAFAEAGFSPEFHIYTCNSCITPSLFQPWFNFSVGGRYHFGGKNEYPALIVRVGTVGINVGISF
jgi:hypothetical protein